jgi:hypothetical protein
MPNQDDNQPRPGVRREKGIPTTSAVLQDGGLAELVYDPKARRTSLALWRSHSCELVSSLELPSGERLVPYSPGNNLIKIVATRGFYDRALESRFIT